MYEPDDPFMGVVDYFLRSLWCEQPDILQERLDRRSTISKSFKPKGQSRPFNSAVREKENIETLLAEAYDRKYHSPRGKEALVADLHRQGYTGKEIANAAGLSVRTVWYMLKRHKQYAEKLHRDCTA
jgi:hypothetical protein